MNPNLIEIIFALILLGIGVLALTLLLALIALLPAIIVAIIIYVYTGNLLYAAVGFVVAAFAWALVKHR